MYTLRFYSINIYITFLQVAGHPRNNNMQGRTFLTIERKDGNDEWTIIATDANWETK